MILHSIPEFQTLVKLHQQKYCLGLANLKGMKNKSEKHITREYIKALYESNFEMCCMPCVIAGLILGVDID